MADTENNKEAFDRGERTALASKQHRALKAWQKAGSPEGERPDTPDYDAVKAAHDNGGPVMPKTRAAATKTARTAARFICNGRVMPDNQNRLSSVAYQYTRGITAGVDRIGSAALSARLVQAGIADPRSPGWKHKLPNDVTIECVADTPALRARAAEPQPKKAPSSKKRAPAPSKKSAPAKTSKPATKKTPGQKQREAGKPAPTTMAKKVTTNFKQPAKKAAAKKTAAARTTKRTATKR